MSTTTAWHIAPTIKRDAIAREGLVPQLIATCVWVFTDRAATERYLPKSWDGSRGANDLWLVDVSGLDLLPDPHPFDEPASMIFEGQIAPDRLRLVASHQP